MEATHRITIAKEEALYLLESEARDSLVLDTDDSGWGTLSFFGPYHKLFDEDGYHPPRSLIEVGAIDEMVENTLELMDLPRDAYRFEDRGDAYGYEMSTFYVLPDLAQCDCITRDALKQYRQSFFVVRVSPKGAESSSSSEEESFKEDDERVSKKSKRQ